MKGYYTNEGYMVNCYMLFSSEDDYRDYWEDSGEAA